MPIGRPTKYDPKYCDEIIEFFDVEHTQILSATTTYKNGDTRDEEKVVANTLPTIEAFCHKIGICKSTLHEWRKKNEVFSNAYKRARDLQENMWLTNSLKGLYPGAFTIFAGKNMFGWRDKKEVDLNVNPHEDFVKLLLDKEKGKK